jgi:pimeloyl-ACP methyl ester carboxylesterase
MTMQVKYFKREEGTIAYDDYGGDGELVIMLPGMGALRSEYRFLAPEVSQAGYRVVVADLRGHGESSAFWPEYSLVSAGQDILALIEHLDAGSAHLIGTSFSPGAAVWAAAQRPDAFRSLVLIGAFVRTPQTSFIQNLLTAVLLNGPWKVAGWATYYRTLYPACQPSDFEEYLSKLKANLRELGRFEALKGLGFASKDEAEKSLVKVDKPALVIMGTSDPDWPDPTAEAQFIADSLSAEVLLVEGAGHYPQIEMPEKVTPSVIEFLGRVSG